MKPLKAFILRKDLIHVFEKLTDNQAGQVFTAILKFANGEEPEFTDDFVRSIYIPIADEIEAYYQNRPDGQYHWNWKGGITPENHAIRNSFQYCVWRSDVFKRDNFTCIKCGQVGGILHAHHIKHFAEFIDLRFDINNGMTLCKKCHNKIHSKNG
jgi:hypothetical protein